MQSSKRQLLRKVETLLSRVAAYLVPLHSSLSIAADCVDVVKRVDPEKDQAFRSHTLKLIEFHMADWLDENEMAEVRCLFNEGEAQRWQRMKTLSRLIPEMASTNLIVSLRHAHKSIVSPSNYEAVIDELKCKWQKQGLLKGK